MSYHFFDSLVNLLAGLGVPGRDKGLSSQYYMLPMTREQVEAAYRADWMARKCIDIPAFDATREWRKWQAQADIIEKIEDVEDTFHVQQKVQQALIKARLYGGSAIVIGVDQGDPSTPLDPEAVSEGSLKFLHVVSRWELSTGPLNRDLTSEYFGEPEYYEPVMVPATGTTAAVNPLVRFHPSRVVRFVGADYPNVFTAPDAWGDSILQIVNDAIQSSALINATVPTLIAESKVDVIKIPNLTSVLQTDVGTSNLLRRFTQANVAKSVINALILDTTEEWERITADLTHVEGIVKTYLMIVTGAADIPATRFLGQSPQGLDATGDSDTRNYYDRVSAEQENKLTPALERLDDVIIRSATGSHDPAIYYEWESLWQINDSETADIALKKAQATAIDVTSGLIPLVALSKARQNQLIEDATYPGLETALEEAEASGDNVPEALKPPPPPPVPLGPDGQPLAPPPPPDKNAPPDNNAPPGNTPPPPPKEKTPAKDAADLFDIADRSIRVRDFNPEHDPHSGQFTSGSGSEASDLYKANGGEGTKTADQIIAEHGAADRIREVEDKIANGVPTDAPVEKGGYMQANGEYTPERQAEHQKILDKIFNEKDVAAATPAPGAAPELHVLGGRGGSGKSFITDPAKDGPVDKSKALLLDSDRIKAMLPEYKGWNAALLHEEATHILTRADDHAVALGINTIHDGTLKSYDNVEARIAKYRNAGYDVNGYFVHTTPATAASRALGRFMRGGETGRYVPPSVILGNKSNEASFDRLKGRFKKWKLYDNNGKAPKLIASGGKS